MTHAVRPSVWSWRFVHRTTPHPARSVGAEVPERRERASPPDHSLLREPGPYFVPDEQHIGRIGNWVSGAMTPNARDRPQRRSGEERQVRLIVRNAEIEIRGAGHKQNTRLDGPQGSTEVTVIQRVGADVGGVPGAKLGI